ncbi:zinc-dependent alcohol dehydrogenase family protein [Nannocystis punicea]|uniref:enoyl-[acyl-carrier-protein] reductase n=1 Tax=Nannocystis punicea TaxID=2995304 RepID=A0ABY7GSI0_9BACT|nr:zinc-dependent alcohol dehydrogenase family protein [Nannocystis poenicansa]WAS89882.1 zinc-dependent alcohol dehydrogenase family protein [Nannocystis poenicansa]
MRAVQFSRFGEPGEVAEVIDLPAPPPPGPGQAAVDLLAAPINPADLLNLRGQYGIVPTLPAIAGLEGVGVVTAIGPGVDHVRVGDRVLLGGGTWRERQVVSAAGLFALPPGLPSEQLAMLTVNPLTARALIHDAQLQPGQWVIKNAANSGVGRAFFTLAKKAGARGIAVVRRPGLEDLLKSWGAEVVLVDGPDLAERVKAVVGDGTLRYAVDAIGGSATARLAATLSPGGVVVNYGLLSGEACQVSGVDLVFRNIVLRGFWLVNWFQHTPREGVAKAFGELIGLLAAGELTTPIEATYPLERVGEALRHAEKQHREGKVLIVIGS